MDELTKEEFEVIFDVLNVYDPNDISHVYPEMGEEKFLKDVTNAWKSSSFRFFPIPAWPHTFCNFLKSPAAAPTRRDTSESARPSAESNPPK